MTNFLLSDLMTSIESDERRETVERKKKQEEYHRILEQQIAEKRQRKQKEKRSQLDVDDLENTTTSHETSKFFLPYTSSFETYKCSLDRSVRSPSPPIKSHYRNLVPVRVPSDRKSVV